MHRREREAQRAASEQQAAAAAAAGVGCAAPLADGASAGSGVPLAPTGAIVDLPRAARGHLASRGVLGAAAAHWSRLARSNDAARLLETFYIKQFRSQEDGALLFNHNLSHHHYDEKRRARAASQARWRAQHPGYMAAKGREHRQRRRVVAQASNTEE